MRTSTCRANFVVTFQQMAKDSPIQIDLDAVVRTRLPRYYRYIPRFLIRRLAKMICQDEMNDMLRKCDGKRDAEFCRGALDHLQISYDASGMENLDPKNRRVILASNHPLGGLDGMILIDFITRVYGPPVKFIVNDLLMAIEPLSGVFLPINKHGRQSREAFRQIDEAMASDTPIIIFPAGLCSRKGKDGKIADLQWQKNFINKAIAHRRDIIPIHFKGQNSKFFYNFARLRTRLHLRLNLEMARLPKEVFRARSSRFSLTVGSPISWQSLRGGGDAQQQADAIRRTVYSLGQSSENTVTTE